MTSDQIPEMAAAYIEAALFTADEALVPPRPGEFDATPYLPRVTRQARDHAEAVCRRFYEDNAADLAGYPARAAGHDLWYTRNGHGRGFWEANHCTDEEGERLTKAAHALGEVYLALEAGRFVIDPA